MIETPIQTANRRLAELKEDRSTWDPHWRDLAEHFLPRKSRWLMDAGEANRGAKRSSKIIDGTPRYAARTLASGMMAGLTSPARPWMRIITPDPDLMELQSVKDWLQQVERRMLDVFAKSNLYNVLPTVYGELGVFGTAAMMELEDPREVVRFRPYTIGSYFLANSSRLTVDTFYCQYQMTVRQMVQEFGEAALSDATSALYKNSQLGNWLQVVHYIQPRSERTLGKQDSKNMPFASGYYELTASGGKLLRETGFEEFPVFAPRWDPTAEDVYGASPGMDALGDAKQLQHDQKRAAKMIDKMDDPPMTGTPELEHRKASLLPGDVTYIGFSANGGHPQFVPTYVPNPAGLVAVNQRIVGLQEMISRAMYEDLFLMLAMSDRKQITATEVAERQEEKLLMLGPVLERLNDELLDPLIERTFNIMDRRGLLPEPPQELDGVDLKVEYISILAQAQKMVATGGIDRLAGFVTSIGQVQPDVLDKMDFDQAVDEYGSALGVPTRIIRSDDDVARMRENRAKIQQAQMMAQAAKPMADAAGAAKDLSETEVGTGSALDMVMGTA